MKKLAVLGLFLMLSGCAARKVPPVQPPPSKDWTITVQWSYDFTNFPICSTTVTKGCINGFTWSSIEGTVVTPLKTSTTSICTGTTQPETCTDVTNALLGIGTASISVVANGIDNNGNAVSSAQSAPSNPLNITLVAPGNVTWSAK